MCNLVVDHFNKNDSMTMIKQWFDNDAMISAENSEFCFVKV